MWLVWISQDKLYCIVTPRSFINHQQCLSLRHHSWYILEIPADFFCFLFFFRKLMFMIWYFSGFGNISLSLHQEPSLSRCSWDLFVESLHTISARLNSSTYFHRRLHQMESRLPEPKNIIGPKLVPCGTPPQTRRGEDDLPWIHTAWVRFVKKLHMLHITGMIVWRTPISINFLTATFYLILSKAFVKSVAHKEAYWPDLSIPRRSCHHID